MEQIIDSPAYFTVALRHAGDDLLVLEIERLRQAVRMTRAELPFNIKGWVVLPDHLHCIWTMPDRDFVTRWHRIMRRFSSSLPKGPRRLARISGQERGIWAKDFHAEQIGSSAEMLDRLNGLSLDPIRHGLVERAEDWPFASFSRRLAKAAV